MEIKSFYESFLSLFCIVHSKNIRLTHFPNPLLQYLYPLWVGLYVYTLAYTTNSKQPDLANRNGSIMLLFLSVGRMYFSLLLFIRSYFAFLRLLQPTAPPPIAPFRPPFWLHIRSMYIWLKMYYFNR